MLAKISNLYMIGENIRMTFPLALKILLKESDQKIIDPEEAEFDPQREDKSLDSKNLVYNNCKTGLAVGLVYRIVSRLDINLCQQLMSAFNATIKIMEQKRNQTKNYELGEQEPVPDCSTEIKNAITYLEQLSLDILSPKKPKHSFAAFSQSLFQGDSQAELQPVYESVKKHNLDLAVAAFLYYFDIKESLDIRTIQYTFEKSKRTSFLSAIEKEKFYLLSNLNLEFLEDNENIKPNPDALYFYKDSDNTQCPFLHLIHNTEEQIENDFKYCHRLLLKDFLMAIMTISDKQSPFVPYLTLQSPQDLIGYLLQFEHQHRGQQIQDYLLSLKPFQEYFKQFQFNLNAPRLPKQTDFQTVSIYADTLKPKTDEEELEIDSDVDVEIDSDVDEAENWDPEVEQARDQRRAERRQRNAVKFEKFYRKRQQEDALRVSRKRRTWDLINEFKNQQDLSDLIIENLESSGLSGFTMLQLMTHQRDHYPIRTDTLNTKNNQENDEEELEKDSDVDEDEHFDREVEQARDQRRLERNRRNASKVEKIKEKKQQEDTALRVFLERKFWEQSTGICVQDLGALRIAILKSRYLSGFTRRQVLRMNVRDFQFITQGKQCHFLYR